MVGNSVMSTLGVVEGGLRRKTAREGPGSSQVFCDCSSAAPLASIVTFVAPLPEL